jgi:hypothetical protein
MPKKLSASQPKVATDSEPLNYESDISTIPEITLYSQTKPGVEIEISVEQTPEDFNSRPPASGGSTVSPLETSITSIDPGIIEKTPGQISEPPQPIVVQKETYDGGGRGSVKPKPKTIVNIRISIG